MTWNTLPLARDHGCMASGVEYRSRSPMTAETVMIGIIALCRVWPDIALRTSEGARPAFCLCRPVRVNREAPGFPTYTSHKEISASLSWSSLSGAYRLMQATVQPSAPVATTKNSFGLPCWVIQRSSSKETSEVRTEYLFPLGTLRCYLAGFTGSIACGLGYLSIL